MTALPVPEKYLTELDPLLGVIYSRHPFQSGILRMEPDTYYDWHVDTNRGVSLNMMLSPGHSHCLFRVKSEGKTGSFDELVYEPDTMYLLNTQIHHSVYNFNDVRYMFSIEFSENKDLLSFDRIASWIRSVSG